jgi:GDPmannose 4,6-dehydratase
MSNQKRALITGVSGQDGSYLAELLLSKGYEVHGMLRRSSTPSTERLQHIESFITLHQSDITDSGSVTRLVEDVYPDEIYNLAAQSFVYDSFDQPVSTGDMTGLGVARILDAVRHINKDIRFYQASSSEMFGKAQSMPQNEKTPFYPRSPYAIAKLYGHWMTVNYRESYDMYCCSGILFNHESPRRGIEFVTRKISLAVAKIKTGKQNKLYLGNLDAKRDWGFAGDYVKAMWLMLQQDEPKDYVIATGEAHTVREFVDAAFRHVGLNYKNYVEVDSRFFRPAEVNVLLGDPSRAKADLGWECDVTFKELVKLMVDADLENVNSIV